MAKTKSKVDMTIGKFADLVDKRLDKIELVMATKGDLDRLAQMTQAGFKETASKDETATRRDFEHLERAFEGLDMKVSAYASRWTGDFETLQSWVKEIDSRVRHLEKAKK